MNLKLSGRAWDPGRGPSQGLGLTAGPCAPTPTPFSVRAWLPFLALFFFGGGALFYRLELLEQF